MGKVGLYLAFVDVSMGGRRSFWVREGGEKERGGGVAETTEESEH